MDVASFDAVAVRWLPAGVPRSLSMVTVTQFTALSSFEITRSPELWGMCVALRWLGAPAGAESEAPTTGWRGWPSARQMLMQAIVASLLADAAPFPEPAWWAKIDPGQELGLDEGWWADRVAGQFDRSYHHGVAVALLWASGRTVDPIVFAPIRYEDFSFVHEEYRQAHARSLSEMWLKYA